jgi:hypothetical protein
MKLGLRSRHILDRWFAVVLVGSLLAAGVGGVLASDAYLGSDSQVETRTVDRGQLTATYLHRATVTANASGTPFEQNTTVRNRSLYFERLMPVLSGEFALRYGGNGSVDVRVDRAIVLRNVESGEGDQLTVYWRQNRSVSNRSVTLAAGERVTVPFRVNVTAARADARAINERVGAPGETQVVVVTTVAATQTEAPGRTRQMTVRLPIESDGSVYRVSADPATAEFSRTVTERVDSSPGPLRAVGGPVLLVVGLAAAVTLGVLRSRDAIALSEQERAWLTYREDRTDFAEWINTVTLPADAVGDEAGTAATLADLVDLAIDAEEPVLHDPDADRYVVFHDGIPVTYRPPDDPAGGDPLAPADEKPAVDLDALADGDVGSSDSAGDGVEEMADAGDGPQEPPDAGATGDSRSGEDGDGMRD